MTFTQVHPGSVELDDRLIDLLVEEHVRHNLLRLQRLWDYYRNPMVRRRETNTGDRPYHLAQEQGLPRRLTNPVTPEGLPNTPTHGGREIVIENDIAWRLHALADFMFGKPVALQSLAPDPSRARLIESLLRRVFDLNGGMGFFQDLALLGSVYGFVDVLLRVNDGAATPDPLGQADRFVLETIEAPRAIPVLNPRDFRKLDGYVLHYRQVLNETTSDGMFTRLRSRVLGNGHQPTRRTTVMCTEVWTDQRVTAFQDVGNGRVPVEQSLNRLGRIPVVHIQNLAQPFFYEGLSEVEPLIPLQDELNTRLSDRANRVTFQSFKMYLGKGIEHFTDRPIGPGQMWATDNPDAEIQAFGGDAANPSEESHIIEIREAMDKTSSVTPIAAGLLRAKVGNLSSENALRIVMMGLLAKTEKKRVTYGVGIERICELILHAADVFGVLPNTPDERRTRLDWPSPLPASESEQLRDARIKLEIGVPQKQVLTELGYANCADK
ncbi:MAG: phage portal protein [Phycisphaeraceae bacterium]